MRRITLGVSSVVFAAVSALSTTAIAQTPTGVEITGYTYAGSGCPAGSVGDLITESQEGLPNTLTLAFTNYIAQQGAGIPENLRNTERRKNCTVTLNLNVPQGFSFSLVQAEYKGFADLPAGVKGIQRTDYSFPFSTSKARFETVLDGEFTDDYERTDEVLGAVWSPCGGGVPLNLETSVFLAGNRTSDAVMTLDRVTSRVTQIYNIQWRQCSI